LILLKLQPDHGNKITWLRVYDYELYASKLAFALIRLGFPPAPALQSLNLARNRNSQAHSTKGTPSLSLRQAPTCCGLMVSGSISLPSPGFFSPFPRGTSALSVDVSCLALDRGRPGFRQGFSSLAVLRKSPHEVSISVGYGALTRSGRPSHAVPLPRTFVTSRATARSSR
jgi:hypothetical protein